MDKQALGMAIFMGLYVPLFTGISLTIHRWIGPTPQQTNKIIIVYRQFEHQSFDDGNKNSIFKLEKSPNFTFSKDVLQLKSFFFYKFLPIAYTRDDNLLQNFDLNKIAINESKVNLDKQMQNNQKNSTTNFLILYFNNRF